MDGHQKILIKPLKESVNSVGLTTNHCLGKECANTDHLLAANLQLYLGSSVLRAPSVSQYPHQHVIDISADTLSTLAPHLDQLSLDSQHSID